MRMIIANRPVFNDDRPHTKYITIWSSTGRTAKHMRNSRRTAADLPLSTVPTRGAANDATQNDCTATQSLFHFHRAPGYQRLLRPDCHAARVVWPYVMADDEIDRLGARCRRRHRKIGSDGAMT